MTRRSLSKREADLVLALEWDKQRLITIEDIVKRLRCSRNYAYKLAHILHKKGWLESVAPGHFFLIGAERGPKGIPEMNPFLLARLLPKPYFFAYRFACVQHGLLTQVPTVIHVALSRPKRPFELKNTRFEFIELSRKRFFGDEETLVMGEKINVSDLERSVLDALDRPELVGGIEAVAQVVFHAGKNLNFRKLLGYLRRFDDSALARRFGYLCELLQVALPKNVNAYLETLGKRIPAYLGMPRRWGTEGELNKRWSLILNVPRKELLGEVRIG
ncbi:MAG TPA: hypothetical protein VI895_13115 [Bdellovibrionota bacterium]|nr:hypothetical protein [Bdellovibrionota bacterium]